MVELIAQNSWLLYTITALACLVLPLVIVLSIIGFAQGREVSTPIFKIGSRPSPVPAPSFTDEQLDDIATRVSLSLEMYRKEQSKARRKRPLSIPGVPTQTAKIFALKLAIDRKIRDLVLSAGGGWAGSGVASFEKFHQLAEQQAILPVPIIQEIGDFNWLIRPGIYGDKISPSQLLDIEDMGAKILKDLDTTPFPGT